jgi:anti-anti-sigma regulatory factor
MSPPSSGPEQVDIRNAADVAEELILAVSRSSMVIIDMSAATFCDCAGARARRAGA